MVGHTDASLLGAVFSVKGAEPAVSYSEARRDVLIHTQLNLQLTPVTLVSWTPERVAVREKRVGIRAVPQEESLLVVIADGSRETSSADSVACQMDKIAQPVLPPKEEVEVTSKQRW